MKRVLCLILALVFAFSLVACAAKPADSSNSGSSNSGSQTENKENASSDASGSGDAEVVKIGSLWPLTGGSASIGQSHADGAEFAIKKINEAGGIKSMGGAKIELVGADTETSAEAGATACERLITEDGVCMIIGAYNSTVCISASEVAQNYSIPFVSMGGVATAVTERGYDHVFRVNNTATYDVLEMITGLDAVLKDLGEDTLTYALIYENSDWGSDNARIWKEAAGERGWTCLVDEPVVNGQADMTSQILKIKESGADVVNCSFYVDDSLVFQSGMYANGVTPRLGIWSVGGGYQDKSFFEGLDKEVYEGVFVQEDWDVSGLLNHQWIADLAEEVKAEYGYNMTSFFAQGWTAAYVAYYALEAAGATDDASIVEALKNLHIINSDDEPALLTGYTEVIFDEKGQNTYGGGATGGTIVQYQDGEAIGMYPESHRFPGATPRVPLS